MPKGVPNQKWAKNTITSRDFQGLVRQVARIENTLANLRITSSGRGMALKQRGGSKKYSQAA